MKWPSSITLIRHGESAYNDLRRLKDADPLYREFKRAYDKRFGFTGTQELAQQISDKYSLGVSDYKTPLTPFGNKQTLTTGHALQRAAHNGFPQPDVVFYSPYRRTEETLGGVAAGWIDLAMAKHIPDDRIREMEHGLSLLYSDWRVFQVLHPEQKRLRDLQGPYWYQYPQGESVSQVRERTRSFTTMLIREWAGKNVVLVTHHLTILSFRANYERLSPEEFIRLDEEEKPINCGVTVYRADPTQGKDGKLILEMYNRKFY
jgi:broad specificity phosphatase PhoE